MNEKIKRPMYNIGEVARRLGLHLGKNQLYAFLKEHDIIDKNNSPYQGYINKGLFEKHVKVQPWNGRLKVHKGTCLRQERISEFPTS